MTKKMKNASDYGWVTAPFQLNDLKDSKTDSTIFGNLVKIVDESCENYEQK